MSKSKYLAKNVFLFSISSFLPKLFAFLLVPIYTTYLTTGEYGIADLISTTTNFIIPIFSFDIQDAVLRFVLEPKYDKKDVLSVSVSINTFGFLFVSIALFIVYSLKIFDMPYYFYIYTAVLFILNSLRNSFVMYCKGIEKVKNIVMSTTILSLTHIGLNILFLTVFKFGIHGYLLSMVISYMASLLYIIISTKSYKNIKIINIDKKLRKDMILYSIPLIFSVIAWWVNNASDRYVITWLLGASASGIYAMSYRIPNIVSIFYGIFSQAWSISAIKEFDKNDKDGFIGNIFMLLNAFLCTLCSIIMISNIFVSKLLFKGDFFIAWENVSILIYAILFYSNAMFIGNIFAAVKDTKFISMSTIVSAVLNTILNIILIKSIGVRGAAYATLVGYFTIFLMRIVSVKKYITMKYNLKQLIISYILLLIQMVLALNGNKYLIGQGIILIVLVLLYKNYIINIINKIFTIFSKKVKLNRKTVKG